MTDETKKEPTKAELFARVESALMRNAATREDVEALALLELRTGALEQEREARKRAERELTAWRAETGAGRPEDAGAAIRNTREDLREAERERDEARGDAEARKRVLAAERVGYQQVLDERDRAVADNAALLDLLECREEGGDTDAEANAWAERVLVALTKPHPGAARLEYVRALEKVREAARAVIPPILHSYDAAAPLSDACDAADALKVTP